jgi:Tfp pilus assembly PilM family ATPase
MATRTSFEIQPGLCRLVEVDATPLGSRRADVRVRHFITAIDVDPDPVSFSATLERLRREHRLARHAAVTIWGLRSTHRFLRVPAAADADFAEMAADHATEEIALIEADGSRASLAVTLGASTTIGDRVEREVAVTAASEPEIALGIEPLTGAGVIVDRVVTPAMSLASLARGRLDRTPAPSLYVALAAHATCIAVVADGVLLMARELPWGHVGPLHPDRAERDESFDQRLAAELRRSILCFRQSFRTTLEAIVLCGDMTGLRRLTQPLGATLELPIETLDSITGIDAEAVPEPANAFHADVAALRLAIAAGAEGEPYSSLIAPVRPSRRAMGSPVALAAAAAAVLVVIAGYVALRPSRSRPAPTLAAAPLEVRVTSTPPTELQVQRSVDLERQPDDAEPELRIDSILFSPERRLAVVNGRIARAGDRIAGSRIVDIQPRAVVVESPARGRRTIEMRSPPRPSSERR